MSYKTIIDFHQEHPGAYVKDGTIYSGTNDKIGYQCGDNDLRTKDGTLYHTH